MIKSLSPLLRLVKECVTVGPNNKPLIGTYKHIETFEYQDQLGLTILNLMKIIPDGVLVFLPSYAILEKLENRWRQSGLYKQLEEEKDIYLEPRSNSRGEFDQLLTDYAESLTSKKGGLIFCIYRGKMSEGYHLP